jgi:hypothetical protein
MSDRGSELRAARQARRAIELSPELREVLHMLDAMEDEPKPVRPREPKRA